MKSLPITSRREMLHRCGFGMGALALSNLMAQESESGLSPLAPRKPQFAGKAKRVIHLFMNGGNRRLIRLTRSQRCKDTQESG